MAVTTEDVTLVRLTEKAHAPTEREVARWLGTRAYARWTDLASFIDATYPGVFTPEWLFAGRKHGWALRYKKSKSFCNFVPERGRFKLLLVFGAAERAQVEAVLPTLASHVRDDYPKAPTYADGKWMLVDVDSAAVLRDIKRLLLLKRKPRSGRG